ncbi:MAG: tetratricopeptide repeat protein [Planctomycetota bacterium]
MNGWARIAIGLATVLALGASEAEAQTRFVGDSPTRIAFTGGNFRTVGARFSRFGGFRPYRSFTYRSGVFVRSPFVYRPYSFGCGYPYYGYGGGFCNGCGAFGSFCRCGGPVFLPPVVLDPSTLYGPRALLRFAGAEDDFGLGQPRPRGAQAAPAANVPAAGMVPPKPRRVAALPVGAGARGRAWKFIDHGDRHFKAGRYREALSRYKKAITSSPELAAARFREGFAHLGLGNLDRAALSIRRGLQRDAEWPDSDFVLEDLFADELERQQAFRSVALQLQDLPNDSEARLLAGVLLHFDGDPMGAEKQFRRVQRITGGDPAAELFLPNADDADEP